MLFLTHGNIVLRGKIGDKIESVISAAESFSVKWKKGASLSVTDQNRMIKRNFGILKILDILLDF